VKILVTHDENGNLVSVAIETASPKLCATLRARHGESITAVELRRSEIAKMRRTPTAAAEIVKIAIAQRNSLRDRP
jgi:hypothetical protein